MPKTFRIYGKCERCSREMATSLIETRTESVKLCWRCAEVWWNDWYGRDHAR